MPTPRGYFRTVIASSVLISLLLAGCSGRPDPVAPTELLPGGTPTASAPASDPEWGYHGAEGPAGWGELPGAEACSLGKEQSPIDLSGAEVTDLPDVDIDYQPTQLTVINTGHAMQAAYQPGSFIAIEGQRYQLLQFHHHSPSEHTVEGKHAQAEFHFVHQNDEGRLAVLGVLVDEGPANEALEKFLAASPQEVGATTAPEGKQIDAIALLPAERDSYRYSGSLTTPPCSEDVTWVVMASPITASRDQLDRLAELSGANNRPVQKLEGRDLQTDVDLASKQAA